MNAYFASLNIQGLEWIGIDNKKTFFKYGFATD